MSDKYIVPLIGRGPRNFLRLEVRKIASGKNIVLIK
jgi:hypothetical protein